ncbi:hypothetical protein [Methanosphaerula palustris]
MLLLDEPFSTLDQKTREECAAMIQTIVREQG